MVLIELRVWSVLFHCLNTSVENESDHSRDKFTQVNLKATIVSQSFISRMQDLGHCCDVIKVDWIYIIKMKK